MLDRPTDPSRKLLFSIGAFVIICSALLAASAGLCAAMAGLGSTGNGTLLTWLAISSGLAALFFAVTGNYLRMRALGKIGAQSHE
jgi:hypothetical protein